MKKLSSYTTLVALCILSSYAQAQSPQQDAYNQYLNSQYGNNSDTGVKANKMPPANFFPGGRSSDNFFADKSVTPNLPGPERKLTFGTDQFPNPSNNAAPLPPPEPESKPEQVSTTQPENVQDENWSANKNQETEEVKTFNENIEKASEQISTEPRVQDVLAQSKRIKEALFGKSTNTTNPGESKSTVVQQNTGTTKVTKEIERF